MISPRGMIIEAPQFFSEALRLEEREVNSIYHLFDDTTLPFLSFERVLRRQNGILEFYVSVIDDTDKPQGFRYWSVSPNQPNRRHVPITFYIVDESSLLQSQEWRRRRLRRDMLNHVRLSLAQFVRNRLTSMVALAELLRDNPDMATETADRMVSSLDEILDNLDSIIDPNIVYDGYDAPRVRLNEAPEIISSWSEGGFRVDGRGHDLGENALVPTDYLERILLPLVQNSIEASYPDEPIEVDIWELGNGYARFDVVDRGDGMNEYTQEHATNPFFSTKPGHIGLGMAQAYEALQSVGGQWRIESEARQGTRITILLPTDNPEDVIWPEDELSDVDIADDAPTPPPLAFADDDGDRTDTYSIPKTTS